MLFQSNFCMATSLFFTGATLWVSLGIVQWELIRASRIIPLLLGMVLEVRLSQIKWLYNFSLFFISSEIKRSTISKSCQNSVETVSLGNVWEVEQVSIFYVIFAKNSITVLERKVAKTVKVLWFQMSSFWWYC